MNLLRRSLRESEHRTRIKERFGYAPSHIHTNVVWIHAVSAGEAIAAAPLLTQLLEAEPGLRFLITSTTPTGSAEITRRFGSRVDHCYIPFDALRCIRRFVRRVRPRCLILMETELWPNLLHTLRNESIPICLVNARLSERSARRYGKVSSLTSSMFRSISMIASQYEDTASRFCNLGYPHDKIYVTGNIKFDLMLAEQIRTDATRLRETWRINRLCWIAASTHPSEDEVALDAHLLARQKYTDLLLVLVPRHPHRADDVVGLACERTLSATKLSNPPHPVDVLVADQMGVLLALYGMADVAFIGGSLQGTGGHNPVESAVFGVPMLIGPDQMNFEEVCKRFNAEGCLTTVRSSAELAAELLRLLDTPGERQRQAHAAQRVVAANRGATQRLFELLRNWVGAIS